MANAYETIFKSRWIVRIVRFSEMSAGESAAHLELKRLALIWAQANGYPIAAREVSLPNLRFRLDVAAYRPASKRVLRRDERWGTNRSSAAAALGLSAIFECKASRADLVRDCRNSIRLLARMKELTEARCELERQLRICHPSLLNGDGLWPEYESAAYERSDHPTYLKLVKSLATLSRQLHGQTKMENLFKWNAANLHYLVVEPDLVSDHEIPVGWGLLVRDGQRLDLRLRPEFKEITEEGRLAILHRVAAAGTKATNREAGVDYAAIEAERRGLIPSDISEQVGEGEEVG